MTPVTTSPSEPEAPTASGGRSPADLRVNGNRLASERSLYLRQHGHNPMDWYPWGPEAIEHARQRNRPIFLSIGYSSCHWCHVMEHEVFEHDDVAAFMNEHFVNIKVDREERPDLDAVYMEAVQLLTGGGGWPMSVFLTPELLPFYGGTYFPRAQFRALTEQIIEVFRTRRGDVESQGRVLANAIAQAPGVSASMPVDASTVAAAVQQAQATFDPRWGGFRSRMKFPTPVRWHFLLHVFRRFGDDSVGDMVRATLDQMAAGGLRDQLGGGFHRYTVDTEWLVPHFEKMLYDNAQLASLFLEASVVFPGKGYDAVARDTLDFLLREMTDEHGGLYASFDADSGGHEGSYYVWTPEELRDVAGARDGTILAIAFGATEEGNFEGSNVLTRRVPTAQIATRAGVSEAEVDEVLTRWVPPLRARRDQRPSPGLDRKVVTAWNGLAISALAAGHRVLGDSRYGTAATRAAEYLWSAHRGQDGSLFRASNEGVAKGDGILDDYAMLACGMLDLHQATGELTYLRRAKELVERMIAGFSHPPLGFFLTSRDTEAPLGRKLEQFDSVEPSGNAAALHAMLRLSTLTGNETLRELVDETLRSHAERLWKAGMEMSWWLDAAQHVTSPMVEVVIAGEAEDPRTGELLQVVHGLLPPHAVVTRVGAEGPDDRTLAELPTTGGKRAVKGGPTAYVCEHGACKRPTGDPVELREQVMRGWMA